jgi:hypothetical protein
MGVKARAVQAGQVSNKSGNAGKVLVPGQEQHVESVTVLSQAAANEALVQPTDRIPQRSVQSPRAPQPSTTMSTSTVPHYSYATTECANTER